jgi:hypothetical protein
VIHAGRASRALLPARDQPCIRPAIPCVHSEKRPVGQLDEDAAVLHRLDGIGDLDQLARGGFRLVSLIVRAERFGFKSLNRYRYKTGFILSSLYRFDRMFGRI